MCPCCANFPEFLKIKLSFLGIRQLCLPHKKTRVLLAAYSNYSLVEMQDNYSNYSLVEMQDNYSNYSLVEMQDNLLIYV